MRNGEDGGGRGSRSSGEELCGWWLSRCTQGPWVSFSSVPWFPDAGTGAQDPKGENRMYTLFVQGQDKAQERRGHSEEPLSGGS